MGIVILVIYGLVNTPHPIVVRLSGKLIFCKLLHPENASDPILCNPLLNFIVSSPLQFENAESPIAVTVFPSISCGTTTRPPAPVYPVIVTLSPFTVYLNSPYS